MSNESTKVGQGNATPVIRIDDYRQKPATKLAPKNKPVVDFFEGNPKKEFSVDKFGKPGRPATPEPSNPIKALNMDPITDIMADIEIEKGVDKIIQEGGGIEEAFALGMGISGAALDNYEDMQRLEQFEDIQRLEQIDELFGQKEGIT